MSLFGAEQSIVTRLRDSVTGVEQVGTMSALSAWPETLPPPVPSLWVMPERTAVTGDPGEGRVQRYDQAWLVVLLIAHQPDALGGDYATTVSNADAILSSVLDALVGWQPGTGLKRLAWQGNPEPIYHNGYGEFPMTFETGGLWTGSTA